MYGLAKVKALNKRGGRIYGLAALAAFILLTLTPAPAQAQSGGKVSWSDIGITPRATIGLVNGQTLSVTPINNFVFEDGSDKTLMCSVKVYDGASNLLYQTNEVEIPAGGYYSFDISYDDILRGVRDVNDIYIFKSPTGRIQVGFEVTFKGGVDVPTGEATDPVANRFPIPFELVDDESGKTVLIGQLLPAIQKVR